jgi:ABC-type glycerol-3-phosphate transport system substrate-binding protein
MPKSSKISRRSAVKLGAAAAALPLVHIRTAGAAGKLNIGFWDHWVPGANDVMQKQVDAWAEKSKVEVTADFITSSGGKLQLTPAAETQAKAGHDVMTFISWDIQNYADSLDPVDDQMKRITDASGAANDVVSYLAKVKGHWVAVPSTTGTQTKPPCARISWFKKNGLDLQAMYPTKDEKNALQDAWTWDAFMKYAELAVKDNMTFGLGMGSGLNTDATDTHGALFAAYGATLIDSEGKSQLKSDAMHQVLEFAQRLVKFYPADAVSYDDASNNRALISGKSALIFNPPSAWAVAKRDAPEVAADCWTFPAPAGPKGRWVPTQDFFWGTYAFSPNKAAGKDLVEFLMQRDKVEARCIVSSGYDLPPYAKLNDFRIWEDVEPPKGTVFNYPLRADSGQ